MEQLSRNRGAVDVTGGEATEAKLLRGESMACLGVLLPMAYVSMFGTLTFLAFMRPTALGAIAIDKVLLFVILLSPAVYAAGFVLSTIALLKSEAKLVALAGIAVSIAMSCTLAYCGRGFLVELRLMIG